MSKLTVRILNYRELVPHQLTCNLYACLRVLSELDKHYGRGTIGIGHFAHYFYITKYVDYTHMFMIAKRVCTSLMFKNPNKMEYTDNWMEIGIEYSEGDVPLNHLSANKCRLVL